MHYRHPSVYVLYIMVTKYITMFAFYSNDSSARLHGIEPWAPKENMLILKGGHRK